MLRHKECCSEPDHDKLHALRNQRVSNMLERQSMELYSETWKHVEEGRSNHLEKYNLKLFVL